MQRVLFKLLSFLQVPRACRYLNRDKIVILFYHGFIDNTPIDGIANYQGMHLNIEAFRRQLQYVSSHYNVIALDQVIAHYSTGRKLPKYSAVITVDDGYRSAYTLAYPVLRDLNMHATIFITTAFVAERQPLWHDRVRHVLNTTKKPSVDATVGGTDLILELGNQEQKLASARRMGIALKSAHQELLLQTVERLEDEAGSSLSLNGEATAMYAPLAWPEVVEMVRSGLISVGSHTRTHVILSRCAPDTVKEELYLSKQTIERETGRICDMFCYPNGAKGDFNISTKEQLCRLGYSCGLTTVPGMNGDNADLMELKRLSAPEDLAEFAVTVAGFKLFLSQLKGFCARTLRIRRLNPNVSGGM